MLPAVSACKSKPEPNKVTEQSTAAQDTTEAEGTTAPKEEDAGFQGLEFGKEIIVASYPSGSAYSRMYVLQDGRMICAWPTKDSGKRCMKAVFSTDDGLSWSQPKVLFYGTDQTKTLANVDIIQLENGRILIAYRSNDEDIKNGNFYSSIRIHASDDNCKTFYPHSTVNELHETGVSGSVGLWEPYFGYLNGELACFFAIGKSVYKEPIIASTDIFVWRNEKWVRAEYTSKDGQKTDRNGMPIWRELSTGGYLMSVETKRFYAARGSSLLPYLLYSPDGKDWVGVTGTFFPDNAANGGAPFWVELPDGRIAVAFQTDEDVKGTELDTGKDNCKVTKIVVSEKGVPVPKLHSWNWSEAYDPFSTPLGHYGNWPGMLIHNGYLYLYTSTDYPFNHIALVRAYVGDMK